MNNDRVKLVLDNYAARFDDPQVLPCADKRRIAAACQAHFDLSAPDLKAMLCAAFGEAASIINYASSVQPLQGLYLLAEQAPEELRAALAELLADDGGKVDVRQVRMQQFAERCNEQLQALLPGKRSWEQSVRSAIAITALLRPAENYLYKSTEARAFADMVGFPLDVAAGAAFRLANYYALGDELAEAIRCHEGLSRLLPDTQAATLHLAVYDVIMNAPAAKWGLFGDLTPLIKTRSRAGQADQERATRIQHMELDLARKRSRQEATRRQIEALPVPDLVGQYFHSSAYGRVQAIRQEPRRLVIQAAGAEKVMALPLSILRGFLVPEDEAIRARYTQEQELAAQQHAMEAEICNRETELLRLKSKP